MHPSYLSKTFQLFEGPADTQRNGLYMYMRQSWPPVAERTAAWYIEKASMTPVDNKKDCYMLDGVNLHHLGQDIANALYNVQMGKVVQHVSRSVEDGIETVVVLADPLTGQSMESMTEEVYDSSFWGPDGTRPHSAFPLDIRDKAVYAAEHTPPPSEDPSEEKYKGEPSGPYFKDIDAKSLLPPPLYEALCQLHKIIAGKDDLLAFHPPVVGITGNRPQIYGPGFVGVAPMHAEEFGIFAYNAHIFNWIQKMMRRRSEVDIAVWSIIEAETIQDLRDIAEALAPGYSIPSDRSTLEVIWHEKSRFPMELLDVACAACAGDEFDRDRVATTKRVFGDRAIHVVEQRLMEVVYTRNPHMVVDKGACRVSCNAGSPAVFLDYGLAHRNAIADERREAFLDYYGDSACTETLKDYKADVRSFIVLLKALLNAMESNHQWDPPNWVAFQKLVHLYAEDARRVLRAVQGKNEFLVGHKVPAHAVPPIESFKLFNSKACKYLCDVCGADILHIKIAFRLRAAEDTGQPEEVRRYKSAPTPPSKWWWDCCYDCVDGMLRIPRIKKQLPKKLLVVQLYPAELLEHMLEGHAVFQAEVEDG